MLRIIKIKIFVFVFIVLFCVDFRFCLYCFKLDFFLVNYMEKFRDGGRCFRLIEIFFLIYNN